MWAEGATRTTVGDVADGEAGRLSVIAVRAKPNRHVPGQADERERRVKMAAHPVRV